MINQINNQGKVSSVGRAKVFNHLNHLFYGFFRRSPHSLDYSIDCACSPDTLK